MKRYQQRIISEALTITEAEDGAAITATLARGNIINRNRRYYSSTVLARAATASRDNIEAGKLIGLMDHPNFWNGEGDKGKPERTVIRWNRLYMDGDDLKGDGTIVETALGRDLLAIKRAKVHIALSTNAYASAHFESARHVPAAWEGDEDELIQVIDEIDELLSVDVVNDPSNVYAAVEQEARLERVAYREETQRMNERDKDKDAPTDTPAPAPLDIDPPADQPEPTNPPAPQEPQGDEDADEEDVQEALAQLRGEIARVKRTSIAREAAATLGVTNPAILQAATLTAQAADSDEAAKTAVEALLNATRVGNGNNRVPNPEARATADDPLRDQRREFTSRVN